ncbi:hypothetical protein [Moorena sp. SIO4G3]|uniref:hypothetical protein n=1 Tax=Moorena sp. SIO4G3 TaxID=2607821 RepID=UPI0025F32C6A|nr:hypothetical protein [Moorena sp. SIO4G3]
MGNAHQYPRYIVGWALQIKIMIERRTMKWAMPTNTHLNVELRIENPRVGIA